jgi:hypothetical protein
VPSDLPDRGARERAEVRAPGQPPSPYEPLVPERLPASDRPAAPAAGTTDQRATELAPEEEPVTTGTLFLTMVVLMFIGAVWIVMYILLLRR